MLLFLFSDQQQELDLPSLRLDDDRTKRKDRIVGSTSTAPASISSGHAAQVASVPVSAPVNSVVSTWSLSSATSTITTAAGSGVGVQKTPSPAKSLPQKDTSSQVPSVVHQSSLSTSDKVPQYGVDTPHEEELGKVSSMYNITQLEVCMT